MVNPQTSPSRGRSAALADSGAFAEGGAIAALRQLAITLAGGAGLSEALRHALLIAARLTDSPHATILLLDERGEQIRYRVTLESGNVAPLEMVARPMMRKGLAGWVARERRAALVQDTETDERWLPGPGLGDLRSAIAAPLICGDRVSGILTLGHERARHYGDWHMDVAQIVAAQVALALASARATFESAEPRPNEPSPCEPPRACDLVALAAGLRGLNGAAERVPPTIFFEDISRAFFQAMTEASHLHDGVVDHLGGDGLLVTFAGAAGPPAAVRAALDMQAAARELAARWRARFDLDVGGLDVGIAHGRAVVGHIDDELGSRAMGEVVDQAVRLQGLARGGEILVSASVAAALPPDFSRAVAKLPPLRLGARAPQQIFNVGAPDTGRLASSVGYKTSNR